MLEMFDVIANYAALLLSMGVVIAAAIRTSRDETKQKLETLQTELMVIKGCAQRLEGANLLERLQTVETRQRADETALVRVEERLTSVDRSLMLISESMRNDGGSRRE